MFAKLVLLILAIGAVACGLLTLRQQRLDAVHEMALLHGRIAELDRDLLVVRVGIARAISPGKVEQLAAKLGPVQPLGVDRQPPTAIAGGRAVPSPAAPGPQASGGAPASSPGGGGSYTLDDRSPR